MAATRAPELFSDWHRLGAGIAVRFLLRCEKLDAEWKPRPPTRREWKRLLERYRAARHQFLDKMAERAGGVVLCLEVRAQG